MAEDFLISISSQLREHLRALRKRRSLTQAQLGERIGVSQARIAEIEANPGVVNLDQLQQLLATLGASLRLHLEDQPGACANASPRIAQEAPSPYPAQPDTEPAAKPSGKKQGSW